MVKLHKHVDIESDSDFENDQDLTVHVAAKTNSEDRVKPESDENDDKVYFMALGGLEHVGQNMYIYKYKGK